MIEGSSSLQNIFDEIFFKATPEKSAFNQPNFYVNINDAKIVYHRGYLGRKNPLFFISILPPPHYVRMSSTTTTTHHRGLMWVGSYLQYH